MICVVGAVMLDYGLRRRKWGRRLRAVGSDPEAAFRLGINPNLTIIRAYMICSLFSALGGIMLMASIGVGDATQGVNFTLAGVTAVNITVFLNLSQAYQYWSQGFLIFFAVGIYTYARNRRANPKVTESRVEEFANA